ncbi:hypothetical protein [Stigmatella aurantiaca]|uniref:Conserved uncharacterized protein n=1 Tax=Stigmatella aurantiaca (strain DW4/3-1) TaxID=378806 RepID=Q094R5_STIAD|nr:hypothetical protein [Stigmatella aurantiaca]ADO73258.1 conserved uncharacterized protein [Stigmatella aurantiaca DW4/3-1]EAU67245.1 hypothetical protein STIAU_7563 [Stigmatella aurantiaca DW4/3-1]
MLRKAIVATLALSAACAPDSQAPVKVQALVLTSNGSYAPREVELTTISDIVRMEGVVAKMIGGARIRSDSQDPQVQSAQTEKAYAKAIIKADGRGVTANYITHDDVLWPADFHTWNLVTAYYNFERAYDYFNKVTNVSVADLGEPATVYYFPEFTLVDSSPDAIKDNALFFSPVQAFMVLPFDTLQKAPLALNAGIMSHEYAHRIFNKKVYAGSALPYQIAVWGGSPASPGANLVKALDEGLADYHAFGTTCASATGCDTRFFSTSFGEKLSNDRDLSKPDRCMDTLLRDDLNTLNVSAFDPYKLGSIIASALYQAGQSTGQHAQLQRALVDAYSDESSNKPGLAQLSRVARDNQANFNLTSTSAVLINHIADIPLKTAVCNELIDHLQIPASTLVGPGLPCPPTAQGGTTCPSIN